MYEVIGNIASRAFRVMWMLEELGQPYEFSPEKPHSERVRSLNPSGKIPILKDGDAVISDSTAILTYLADKHGALTYPAGTVERAQQDSLTHQILDEIDAVLWTAARHSFVLPEDKRVSDVKPSLMWEYSRNVANIMARAKGPYLMGDMMTIPDIILTHCGGWALSAKFPTDNAEFKTYLKNARARPAFQKLRK
ncbi:glutathione S-transferase family protein [Shimia aestuarii]|uniref:Glutathione S-transferase n=1 Tax=Shimia aestuarii TaxID=254406 RepID=A0A1I4MS10_9RHOB|nr:glutathione S-transferase family protein [Shimia aestuarii]SFM05836.1 glutathione S-transferase [Shimia aestuarii]